MSSLSVSASGFDWRANAARGAYAVSPAQRPPAAANSAAATGGDDPARFDTADRVELSTAAHQSPEAAAPANRDDGAYGLNERSLRRQAAQRRFADSTTTADNRAAQSSETVDNAKTKPQAPASSGAPAASDDANRNQNAAEAANGTGEDEGGADGEKTVVDDPSRPRGKDGEPLDDGEAAQVRELKRTDRTVRQHERAHVAAGGGYVTRGAQYEYQQGPDGKRYAVGGDVGIDVSPESTPAATISKMQTVRSAALAPANPSPQDRAVAATASQRESEARTEQRQQRLDANKGESEADATGGADTEAIVGADAGAKTPAAGNGGAGNAGESSGRLATAMDALNAARAS